MKFVWAIAPALGLIILFGAMGTAVSFAWHQASIATDHLVQAISISVAIAGVVVMLGAAARLVQKLTSN